MSWEIAIITVFVLGYLAIAFEHPLGINKASPALLIGVITWAIYAISSSDAHLVNEQVMHHLSEISGILFFLIGAMTIVELIDLHDGFYSITSRIRTTNKRKLLWLVSSITFVLSAVLDNLTTSIVMVSLLRKIIKGDLNRKLFAGMIIISANAGGAFSPIGDVTTTMLWIGGQISPINIIYTVFIPSVVCMVVPLSMVTFGLKGNFPKPKLQSNYKTSDYERRFVLLAGVSALVFVPVFKTITHLPPFYGMFFGLGALWLLTEVLHKRKEYEEKSRYSVLHAISRIDTPSVLFFFGILSGITCLEAIGKLDSLAQLLEQWIGNMDVIVLAIGVLSALVDNVPLVAASMGMYDLAQYPMDHKLWEFMAYCAGTGGSILIIGSASGVAVMGIQKIDFFWYLKKIGWLAAIGYFAGAITYLVQYSLLHPGSGY